MLINLSKNVMTIKQDHKIMEILGVNEIRHLIAHTSKGELTFMLRQGGTEYQFVLDAVPVEKNANKELTDILFPQKQIEIPQVNKEPVIVMDSILKSKVITITPKENKESSLYYNALDDAFKSNMPLPKPKGRPKGSKNK